MNQSFLPSKKFITVVISLLLLVGIGTGIYLLVKKDKVEDPELAIQAMRASEKDKDKDGLKDWEELLWGTDKGKGDTDGDGTSDGEEVKNNRDPKIAGPNDRINSFQKDNLYKVPSERSVSNKTKNLFNASLPKALELADRSIQGEEISDAEIDALIAPYSIPMGTTSPSFNDASVIVQEKTDYIAYAEAINELVQRYSPLLGDELEIATKGLSSKDANLLLSLRSIALRYETFATELIKIPVPRSVFDEHLAVANGYAEVSGTVLFMSSLTIDPLQGLVAVRDYKTATDEADAALADLFIELSNEAANSVQ